MTDRGIGVVLLGFDGLLGRSIHWHKGRVTEDELLPALRCRALYRARAYPPSLGDETRLLTNAQSSSKTKEKPCAYAGYRENLPKRGHRR